MWHLGRRLWDWMRGRADAHAYVAFLERHKWAVMATAVLVPALAALPAAGLKFTADYRAYLGPSNPELKAFEAFERIYTSPDMIFIAVAPADSGDDVFNPQTLRLLTEITEAGWLLPHAVRVDSIINFQSIEANGDDLLIGDLVPAVPRTADRLDAIRAQALGEPLLVGRLLAPDARTAGVLITLQFPGSDHTEHIPASVTAAQALVEQVRADYGDHTIVLTGMATLSNALVNATKSDLFGLMPLMLAVLIVVMAVLLRSAAATGLIVLIVLLAAGAGLGIAGLADIRLTSASAAAPVIIVTLAVADCVHIIMTLLEGLQAGKSRREALAHALNLNAEPVLLTSVTTVIGFLSLNFSESPPFHDLGNITAAGVGVAWALAMTLLPAALLILPLGAPRAIKGNSPAMARFGDFVVLHRRPILWVSATATLLFLALIPLNELNDDFVRWFDKSMPERRATDFVTERLTGPYPAEFNVESGKADGIAEPAYLEELEQFAGWLEAQPEVAHVWSFTDIMKRLNKAMHGGDPDRYRLPEDRALAAQYLLLYELSLPYGLDLNAQINVPKSATRLTVTLKDLPADRMRDFRDRTQDWVRDHTSAIESAEVTGTAIVFAFASERIIRSMFGGVALAFALISLTIVLALGSVRLGLISLIPNVLPVVVTFGVWGLGVGQIGMIASAVTAATLGLVVDDTVHVLTKYHRAREDDCLNVHDGIRSAYQHVGKALVVTTVILVAGFGVLTLSDFVLNVQLGVLSIATVSVALVLDFLLLPAILMWLEQEEECPCRICARQRAREAHGMGS